MRVLPRDPKKIYVDIKTAKKVLFTIAFILGFTVGMSHLGFKSNVRAGKVRCSDFTDQATSQRLYESNPKIYKYLDRDHDSVVCEDLLPIHQRD